MIRNLLESFAGLKVAEYDPDDSETGFKHGLPGTVACCFREEDVEYPMNSRNWIGGKGP